MLSLFSPLPQVTVVQRARNPGKQETFPFMLDESLKNITIYITGTSIAFTLTSPAGISPFQFKAVEMFETHLESFFLLRVSLCYIFMTSVCMLTFQV